jgi:hypothetical protein
MGSFQTGIPWQRATGLTGVKRPRERTPERGLLPVPRLLGVPSRATRGSLRRAPSEGTVPTSTLSPPPVLPRHHSRMNMATPNGEGVLIAAETSLWQLRPTAE